MANLHPCPFCGGKVQISRIPGQGVSAICTGCGAIAMLTHIAEREQLAAAWNKRTVRVNFSNTSTVKQCPFCASQVQVKQTPNGETLFQCNSCGMLVSFIKGGTRQTSLAYWNSRV